MTRVSTFALILGLAWLGALPGSAQDADADAPTDATADEEARGLFLAGDAAFRDGRLDDALEYFEAAYARSPRPGLLFNIGHTRQLLGDAPGALEAYREYLRALPDADNRVTVEGRVAQLQDRVAEQSQSDPTASPTPQPPPSGVDGGGGPPIGAILLTIGGAVLAGGGGLFLGLASGAASDVEDAPPGTFWVDVEDADSRAGTFSVVGTVLLAAGGAAVAGGLVWWIVGSASTEVVAGPTGIVVRGQM